MVLDAGRIGYAFGMDPVKVLEADDFLWSLRQAAYNATMEELRRTTDRG